MIAIGVNHLNVLGGFFEGELPECPLHTLGRQSLIHCPECSERYEVTSYMIPLQYPTINHRCLCPREGQTMPNMLWTFLLSVNLPPGSHIRCCWSHRDTLWSIVAVTVSIIISSDEGWPVLRRKALYFTLFIHSQWCWCDGVPATDHFAHQASRYELSRGTWTRAWLFLGSYSFMV